MGGPGSSSPEARRFVTISSITIPERPSVRGVRRSCLESCFPGFSCHWQSLTLLPPLARKLGALTAFAYPVLAAIAPLRTHFLGLLVKPVAR